MGMEDTDFVNLNENFANVRFDVTDGSLLIYTTKYKIAWLYDTDQIITDGEMSREYRKITEFIRNYGFDLIISTGNVVADATDQSQWDVFNKGMEKFYDDKNPTEVLVVGGENETVAGSKFLDQEELRDTEDVFDKDKDLYEEGKGFAYRFEVDDVKMMIVALDADALTDEGIKWAKDKLNEYKTYTGILMVDNYLLSDFTKGEYIDEDAKELEEQIVKACSNVKFVFSSSSGYTSHHTFNYGTRKVIALNMDIKEAAAQGYFTTLSFDEQLRSITVDSYSPSKCDYVYDNGKQEEERFVLYNAF